MSTDSQNQEVDLGQVFKKIGNLFQKFLDSLFDGILFVKRNIIVFIVLIILGGALGFYLDTKRSYISEIIVRPNFDSVDYLYSKVDLFNTQKSEKDSTALNTLGFKNLQDYSHLKIEPIVDIYKYLEEEKSHERDKGRFDLLKLMAEEGSINQIIESNEALGKNYPYHKITFLSAKPVKRENVFTPLLVFLNDSKYFNTIEKQSAQNFEYQIKEIDSTITQIDKLLESLSTYKPTSSFSINESNEINEIFKVKRNLNIERTELLIDAIKESKTINEVGVTLNIEKYDGVKGKFKFIIPFLFILTFFFMYQFRKFYKKQLQKRQLA